MKEKMNKRVSYICGFCGDRFSKLSECAEHIEKKSLLGIVFPSDIKLEIKE